MIACKEQVYFFEQLATRHQRVYRDACDVGVRLDPALKNAARDALAELRRTYRSRLTRYRRGSTTEVDVTVEQDGGHYEGFTLTVTYSHVRRHPALLVQPGEYLSVELQRASWSEPTFRRN